MDFDIITVPSRAKKVGDARETVALARPMVPSTELALLCLMFLGGYPATAALPVSRNFLEAKCKPSPKGSWSSAVTAVDGDEVGCIPSSGVRKRVTSLSASARQIFVPESIRANHNQFSAEELEAVLSSLLVPPAAAAAAAPPTGLAPLDAEGQSRSSSAGHTGRALSSMLLGLLEPTLRVLRLLGLGLLGLGWIFLLVTRLLDVLVPRNHRRRRGTARWERLPGEEAFSTANKPTYVAGYFPADVPDRMWASTRFYDDACKTEMERLRSEGPPVAVRWRRSPKDESDSEAEL